jgi:hypothetical protein
MGSDHSGRMLLHPDARRRAGIPWPRVNYTLPRSSAFTFGVDLFARGRLWLVAHATVQ